MQIYILDTLLLSLRKDFALVLGLHQDTIQRLAEQFSTLEREVDKLGVGLVKPRLCPGQNQARSHGFRRLKQEEGLSTKASEMVPTVFPLINSY